MGGKTILLVEDNAENAELVKRFLGKHEHKVIWAQNGTEAVQLYQNHRPDLVLLDIMMPGIDGFVTLRKMRAFDEQWGKRSVIIMLTARGGTEDVLTAVRHGANDYLVKPISEERLIAKVNKYLGGVVKSS
ncbi:MAG: response regulator [Leptospiraceae bacterium]|nr:response regulator [Leptospiraceae bacterium]MDW8306389.1 response regulator [Leptospiraceae bacterium]